jgi:endo-alpha-1,4-polygalactosaminidase (GH114 family)
MYLGKVTMNNSLAESMRTEGDHLLVSFLNEFDHLIDADFEENLIAVDPKFSEENDFKKDVQLTFDENVINNQFQALFNSNRVISVQETLLSLMPDSL